MAANNALVVAGLDFDSIRLNLRNYLASKPEFTDFDFNASAVGTLLDLLAYNTQLNAFYINMGVNESFLDSAVIRDSVVSRAKQLGYLPRSAQGPTANVKISFTTAVATETFKTLTIAKDTQFSATINGTSFRFVTPQSYIISANSSNGFEGYVDIVEGKPVTHRYAYSTSNTSFQLPNEKVDTRSVTVSVTEAGNTQVYALASDLRTINSISKVFFIEPDRDSTYKVIFGDGILGRKPLNGSTVAISYRVCNGVRTNGANTFSAVGNIAGEADFTITPQGRAAGGVEAESISSIKYNAPRSYQTQNRAVVPGDYEQILLRENSDISAVAVWGGQENDPPIYGKTFISLKPVVGVKLSTSRQDQIKNDMKRYKMPSIETEIIDPSYLYIMPSLIVRYDTNLTTRSASEIAAEIANRVISYEATNLNDFYGKFRYSRFLDYIDDTDKAIVGSSATIDLQFRFVPTTNKKNNYTFKFNRKLQKNNPSINSVGTVRTSKFVFKNFESYVDDYNGDLRIFYNTNKKGIWTRTYTDAAAGTINYETGKANLVQFQPDSYETNFIKFIARPRDYNIEPIRNQILLISDASILVIEDNTELLAAKVDSVATIGEQAIFETQLTAISPITV